MRFLVTGGAGFLGSALANRLATNGHTVFVLDDLSNGNPSQLLPAISLTQGDIGNIPLLWSLLRDVDCVYHLAARVSVAESVLHPQAYNRGECGRHSKPDGSDAGHGCTAGSFYLIWSSLRPFTHTARSRKRHAQPRFSLCRQQMGR